MPPMMLMAAAARGRWKWTVVDGSYWHTHNNICVFGGQDVARQYVNVVLWKESIKIVLCLFKERKYVCVRITLFRGRVMTQRVSVVPNSENVLRAERTSDIYIPE